MNNWPEKIAIAIIMIFLGVNLICGIIGIGYMLNNPELTRTQVMIWSFGKFWWLYIIDIIVGIWLGSKK